MEIAWKQSQKGTMGISFSPFLFLMPIPCPPYPALISRSKRTLLNSYTGFPGGSAAKESTCNVGDLGSIPGLGMSLGEGKGYPLQYSGLENSMDCISDEVTESQTQLSDFPTYLAIQFENIYPYIDLYTNVHNQCQ